VESTLESVVDNAYVYGRDWISQQVIISDIGFAAVHWFMVSSVNDCGLLPG